MANTIVRTISLNQIFPDIRTLVPATATWAQGDLLMFDPVNYVVNRLPSEASATTFLGIADQDMSAGNVVSPYSTSNNAAIAVPALNGPLFGVVAQLILQTGTTLHGGDPIYASPTTNAGQGCAATGTKIIGVYQGPAVTTSTAGQVIEVSIMARYPGDTLKA
jgi:hypothetical protein